VFGLLFGPITALGGAALALFAARLNQELAGEVVIIVTGAAFALLGAYIFVSVLRSQVLLFPDQIEIRGAIQTRVLTRADIQA
jgi:hypothetical protein